LTDGKFLGYLLQDAVCIMRMASERRIGSSSILVFAFMKVFRENFNAISANVSRNLYFVEPGSVIRLLHASLVFVNARSPYKSGGSSLSNTKRSTIPMPWT
jgi:hypothetical protein